MITVGLIVGGGVLAVAVLSLFVRGVPSKHAEVDRARDSSSWDPD